MKATKGHVSVAFRYLFGARGIGISRPIGTLSMYTFAGRFGLLSSSLGINANLVLQRPARSK